MTRVTATKLKRYFRSEEYQAVIRKARDGSVTERALTPRQRRILVEASQRRWVSTNMFARDSLCRLEARGLLERHESGNRALFVITAAGREAIS